MPAWSTMRPLLLATLALLGSAAATAASFDCNKATTRVEMAICGSPRLSSLDGELGDLYRQILPAASSAEDIRADQRRWIKSVRDVCQDEACLADVYERRLHLLGRYLAKTGVATRDVEAAPLPKTTPSLAPPGREARPGSGAVEEPSSAATIGPRSITRLIVHGLPLLALLVYLGHGLRKKHAKWKLVLSGIGIVGLIGAYAEGSSSPADERSAADASRAVGQQGREAASDPGAFEQRLTGYWTMSDDVRQSCANNNGVMQRRADGTVVFHGDDGRAFLTRPFKLVKLYDKDLGTVLVGSEGDEAIYWVVQFSGQDLKTSVRTNTVPPSKDDAQEVLRRSTPGHPDLGASLHHRCPDLAVKADRRMSPQPLMDVSARRTVPAASIESSAPIEDLRRAAARVGPGCPSSVVGGTFEALAKIRELERYGQRAPASNLAMQRLMMLRSFGCIPR